MGGCSKYPTAPPEVSFVARVPDWPLPETGTKATAPPPFPALALPLLPASRLEAAEKAGTLMPASRLAPFSPCPPFPPLPTHQCPPRSRPPSSPPLLSWPPFSRLSFDRLFSSSLGRPWGAQVALDTWNGMSKCPCPKREWAGAFPAMSLSLLQPPVLEWAKPRVGWNQSRSV